MRKSAWFLMVLVVMAFIGCKPKPPETTSQTVQQGASTSGVPQASTPASAPKLSAKLPGGSVLPGAPDQLGFIFWGADYAMFYCNGGLQTRDGTICAEYDLNFKLEPGDNMDQQIADYKAGKTHFLRGVYQMIGKRVVELCKDPDLCPIPFLQMTWSAGDHLVCREAIKDLKELPGKTISMQTGGPHEGFSNDLLEDVNLKFSDVKIKWMPNVFAEGSPSEAFKNDPSVDCAFVVTPDMIGLTGGLQSVGSGAEGSVKGAHVLVSTNDRRRSIPDMYFVSAKFARENPEVVTKFTAAYLKSVEKILELKSAFESSSGSPEYEALLAFAVETYGTKALPNSDEAHGLLLDSSFVGHAGNVQFFDPKTDIGNAHFSKRSNDLAAALNITTERMNLLNSPIDWTHTIFSGLKSANIKAGARFNAEASQREIEKLDQQGVLDANTVLSFVIYFNEDQTEFDATKYSAEFDRVIKLSKTYTRAPIVIRGHTDTTGLIAKVLRTGMKLGVIQQAGSPGNYSYSMNGEPLDLKNAKKLMDLVHMPTFNEGQEQGTSPAEIAKAAQDFSLDRAEAVRASLLAYASNIPGANLDPTQIQVKGEGVTKPFILKPRSEAEAAKNRRVEFSIIRVSAEATSKNDFEL
ncbi:MAG: ABC transporter substrate-binding protein [Patescibacteria group bacterium]